MPKRHRSSKSLVDEIYDYLPILKPLVRGLKELQRKSWKIQLITLFLMGISAIGGYTLSCFFKNEILAIQAASIAGLKDDSIRKDTTIKELSEKLSLIDTKTPRDGNSFYQFGEKMGTVSKVKENLPKPEKNMFVLGDITFTSMIITNRHFNPSASIEYKDFILAPLNTVSGKVSTISVEMFDNPFSERNLCEDNASYRVVGYRTKQEADKYVNW